MNTLVTYPGSCAAATFADLRGISVNQIADASTANFFKLFHRATV